jgi:hypothetical protein
MAWLRHNRYYYRSRKIGGRVVSEYLGAAGDPLAELEAERDELRQAERAALRLEREKVAEVDQVIDQAGEMTRALVRAALLLAGYHPHERTWRRRRYDTS